MSEASLALFLAEPLAADVAAAIARIRRLPDVLRVAVMPDVHLAGDFCVGCVVATSRTLYPDAVGGDIGCGMAAMPLVGAAALDDERVAARIFRGLRARIPVMSHRQDRQDPALLELLDVPLSRATLARRAAIDARRQFATLGRGNHFLEVQRVAGDEDVLWITVHSGSRGLGPMIRDAHLPRGQQRGIDAGSAAGLAYLADVAWARRFAECSRLAMLESAARVLADDLGGEPRCEERIAADHNHVRHETHAGVELFVHRKGAIAALPGELAIVPGSMGTASFHVEGRGNADALDSSAHGAGRRLTRADAVRRISERRLRAELEGVFVEPGRIASLREEPPSAYKDIGRVMRAQRDLVRVVRKLHPLLVYKGT